MLEEIIWFCMGVVREYLVIFGCFCVSCWVFTLDFVEISGGGCVNKIIGIIIFGIVCILGFLSGSGLLFCIVFVIFWGTFVFCKIFFDKFELVFLFSWDILIFFVEGILVRWFWMFVISRFFLRILFCGVLNFFFFWVCFWGLVLKM